MSEREREREGGREKEIERESCDKLEKTKEFRVVVVRHKLVLWQGR